MPCFVRRHRRPLLAALLVACAAVHVACDESDPVKERLLKLDGGSPQDGGSSLPDATIDAPSVDGGPIDCVQNPKTHLEIINACTTAAKVTKNPTLPMLLPDGGLPPLP